MKKKNLSIIVINSQSKMEWIRTDDILFLECASNYTDIHMAGGKIITVCNSLTGCCDQLDSSIIYHLCAHYAVNVFQIKEYVKASRTLKFSEKLSVVIPEDKVSAFYRFLDGSFTIL